MSRHCERPGCTTDAGVLYGIVLSDRRVWLENGDVDGLHEAGVLCKRHADSMVVPRGWSLDDRRHPMPRLFNIGEPEPESATQSAPRHPRRRRVSELEVPGLFDAPIDPEDEQEVMPAPPLEMAVVEEWRDDDTREIVIVEPVEDVNEYTYEPLEDEELSVDESKAHPWVPEFGSERDFTQGLSTNSRLLGRAFGVATEPDAFEFDQPES